MSELTAHLDVPLGVRAVSAARRAVRAMLVSWRFTNPDWLGCVEVVVSELVSNAVRHGGGCLAVQLAAHDRDATVSVADGSAVCRVAGDDVDGRGVLIIEALTRRWVWKTTKAANGCFRCCRHARKRTCRRGRLRRSTSGEGDPTSRWRGGLGWP